MSGRKKSHKDHDRKDGHRSGGKKGMSLITTVVICACLFAWSKSHDGQATDTPKTDRVCTQYFKGGC